MEDILPYLNVRQPLLQHRIHLSPDGKYVAYVVQGTRDKDETLPPETQKIFAGCSLYVTEVYTGHTCKVMKNKSGRSWAPSWSKDSSKLAFYADNDGEVKLYIWEPTTKDVKQICK